MKCGDEFQSQTNHLHTKICCFASFLLVIKILLIHINSSAKNDYNLELSRNALVKWQQKYSDMHFQATTPDLLHTMEVPVTLVEMTTSRSKRFHFFQGKPYSCSLEYKTSRGVHKLSTVKERGIPFTALTTVWVPKVAVTRSVWATSHKWSHKHAP